MMQKTLFNVGANRCFWRFCAATLLLSLMLATRGLALDPNRSIYQYNCQTWSQQDGLPANGINAIAQTDDGYLWLGASAGLIRFDGINFTLVGMPQTPGLRTTEIRSLAASRGGNLWFGIKLSAYGRYDGHGHWTLAKESTDGTDWDVPFVVEAKDGRLWIGGERASVRSPDGQVQQLFTNDPTITFANCGLADSRGRIWIGTNRKGLFCLDQGKWAKFSGTNFDSVIITALAEDKEGRLWVAAETDLICYDAHGEQTMSHDPGGKISCLLVDHQGALWVGTFGNGLLRYYNGVWSSLKKADGMADDFVLSLAEDKEGSLWVGSRQGLSQLTDVKLPTFGINEGLNTEIALGVSASPRGGLWVGTPEGAAYFDGQAFNRNYYTNADLQTGYTKRVLEARNGDLYVLNGKNEINIYSGGNLVATQPTSNMPVAMTEDAQGVVVSIGPDLYRVGRDYLTPLAFTNGVKPDLYWIINLATGRDGALLVAGVNGICRIKNGVFEQWTLSDGLADNHAAWVFEDTDGTIWAALEKGIVRIRGREIRNISREAGLFDGNICSLVPDDHGNFWADSNRGIFSVSRQELNDFCDGKISHVTCVSYDGLASIKPSDKYGQEQSACRTLDGRIWFPSARGVVMVSTNISLNALPPPVHIASVSANGHEISITNGITIPPGKGELEFQYDALSYIAPREIRFRYQLDGYDHQWVEAKDRRFAVYNNLKPGRYTFHVIAANADGVWSDAGDSLTFKLLPHFYQTVWFYLLDGALVLAALGGIYARRVRYLTNRHRALQQQSRQKMDELESRVAERTKELATSLSLLNATLESTTDGVLAMDLTGKITSFNAKFAAMWQFPAELLKRRDGAETVPYACRQVKDPEKFLEQIKRSQSEPEVETFSLVECKDGRIFERYSQPQRIDNKCVGVVVNWRDITERRKLEEQLRQSQKMDAVGKLAGGVAHDFNNILAVMQMQAGLLKNGGELSNEQVKFIDEISATIQRAADLTRQLLLFSRKKTPQRHDLDLNQLTGNMAKMLGRILGEDIALQLKLSPQPMFVHADAGMMDQVLMNLTVNARDAMPKGGQLLVETSAVEFDESVRAQSATARHGAFVCLSVTDTGCGIPPKILPRIFEPFFTTKDVGKGTGLGLATVFGIVEQHQGWINVYSEVGCGTTFKVYLPRLLTNASQKTAPLAAAPATAGKETILIVEDERPLRAALQMALSRLGYRILEAPSGGAALKVWQEHRTEISLMLTDLMMPDGMSGKELAQRVLQENPKLKVIYMSGYSAEIADKDLILQEGINFLAKPFELHKLAKVIRDSLDKSKAVPLTEPEQLRHSLAIA